MGQPPSAADQRRAPNRKICRRKIASESRQGRAEAGELQKVRGVARARDRRWRAARNSWRAGSARPMPRRCSCVHWSGRPTPTRHCCSSSCHALRKSLRRPICCRSRPTPASCRRRWRRNIPQRRRRYRFGAGVRCGVGPGGGDLFLVENLDRGFRSGEQIEQNTGARSLGLVPHVQGAQEGRVDLRASS